MTETRYYGLRGGMDLVTPPIEMSPGRLIASVNYEPHPRGYQRIDGLEQFDGMPKPSNASYWVLNFDQGTAGVLEGETVTGGGSGATGVALIDAVIESGSYVGGDAEGYLVLTGVSDSFDDDELATSASGSVTVDGAESKRGALTSANDSTWLQDAIETARALIDPVPGSGRIRGVWVYKGVCYAFRDNVAATECLMYKSSASGWTQIDLGEQIDFDAGTVEFTEGGTLTGGGSGATATIERVVVQTGDWTTNDADGYIILSDVTNGPFQNNEAITDGSGGSATADGVNAAITLSDGGRYDFWNHNFYGSSDLTRMYGCNGIDRGFEYDGSAFVPVRTGMVSDKPQHVWVHKEQLFFSFAGGSIQHAGPGDPYTWTILTGAGEIAIGEDITGAAPEYNGVLIIFGRNKIAVLYGDDAANWTLDFIAEDSGGVEWTIQKIGTPLYLDDVGVRFVSTAQQFGDFPMGTLTRDIEPLFRAKHKAGVSPIASVRCRAKDQYRLFWDDGTGITIYFGREFPEIAPFDLGKVVYAICSSEDSSGNEIMFFGSDDGYVYQLDAGTSLNGSAVTAYARFPFNHVGSPEQNKRWLKAILEVESGPDTTLGLVAEFTYADPDQPPSQEIAFDLTGGGGFWGEALWGEFYWSSPVEGRAETALDGLGTNVSITAISEGIYEAPHILHGMILFFNYRGLAR